MIGDQNTDLDAVEIEAKLQQLIDAWVDDSEPTRQKIRKHSSLSARRKIDRWVEERALETELDDYQDHDMDYHKRVRRERRIRH